MPSIVPINGDDAMRTPTTSPTTHQHQQPTGVTKFTNCRLVKDNSLVEEDLWISSITGKILNGQELIYEQRLAPDRVIDLGGRIISPGFIDVQLNGGYDFDFSMVPEEGLGAYGKGVARVNKSLITTGVTSYLPTLTSQRPEVYQKALPFLGPSGHSRNSQQGSESLGAHCEGPFLSPTKNGCHSPSVLQIPTNGLSSLQSCYGPTNLESGNIKLVTLAPELPGALDAITSLKEKGIIASIGHTEATYEQAVEAVHAGAEMITHLFNAMRPLHHRNPGIFGLLGSTSTSPPKEEKSKTKETKKPFYGLIPDGIHLHPTTLTISHSSHPSGTILVTDSMRFSGMPDGLYPYTNRSRIRKRGSLLTLEENGRIAGSCISLIECVNNFWNWTGCAVHEAVAAVTETPARMLGLKGIKGSLREGADADLCVLRVVEDEEKKEGQEGKEGTAGHGKKLVVEQVWKFGVVVCDKDSA